MSINPISSRFVDCPTLHAASPESQWPPSRPVHLHSGSRSALIQLSWRFFGSADLILIYSRWLWDDYDLLSIRDTPKVWPIDPIVCFWPKWTPPVCFCLRREFGDDSQGPSQHWAPRKGRFAAVFANGPIIDGFHLSEVISFEGILWLICLKIWTSTLKIVIQESTTRWWVFPFFLDIPMKMNMTMERSRNTLGQRPDLT